MGHLFHNKKEGMMQSHTSNTDLIRYGMSTREYYEHWKGMSEADQDAQGFADSLPEPEEHNWPRSPSHLVRRHKRCRVTEEFNERYPLPEESESEGN
jgi:hypothetical protein